VRSERREPLLVSTDEGVAEAKLEPSSYFRTRSSDRPTTVAIGPLCEQQIFSSFCSNLRSSRNILEDKIGVQVLVQDV
jgi:hypothetical protein